MSSSVSLLFVCFGKGVGIFTLSLGQQFAHLALSSTENICSDCCVFIYLFSCFYRGCFYVKSGIINGTICSVIDYINLPGTVANWFFILLWVPLPGTYWEDF